MLRHAMALVLMLGASTAFAADGTVSGSVRVGDKPLAAGRIIFHLDGGQFVGAKIKDGAYRIDRVPVGTHKITVEGDGVPARHASDETSSLTIEVKEGNAVHNFNLR